MEQSYTIVSSDKKFQLVLIDLLNDYPVVEPNSTRVRIAEGDAIEALDAAETARDELRCEIERLRAEATLLDRIRREGRRVSWNSQHHWMVETSSGEVLLEGSMTEAAEAAKEKP